MEMQNRPEAVNAVAAQILPSLLLLFLGLKRAYASKITNDQDENGEEDEDAEENGSFFTNYALSFLMNLDSFFVVAC